MRAAFDDSLARVLVGAGCSCDPVGEGVPGPLAGIFIGAGAQRGAANLASDHRMRPLSRKAAFRSYRRTFRFQGHEGGHVVNVGHVHVRVIKAKMRRDNEKGALSGLPLFLHSKLFVFFTRPYL